MSVALHQCNWHLEAMNKLNVVFGTGQIGTRIARILLGRGERVRVVARRGTPPAGAELAAGDARDNAFAAEASRGAAVVYDTMNPLYHHWKQQLVPVGAGALHGATVAGAKLVALDCLYMYGAPAGPMTEDAPIAPCSKKGALRAELAELRLSALRRGDARVAIGRASDFFGPALPASWWSERFWTRVLAGKPAECLGDPDMPHSYTYADDVARALVALGDHADATGVWHLPTGPAESTRALANRIGKALDLSIAFTTMSPLMLRAIGVFAPFMRELPEMAYQWQRPFVLDDTKFRTRFGFGATPIDEQVAATLAWARESFAAKRAA
jgi:nucleoside-diphosphate-sugar epimerase